MAGPGAVRRLYRRILQLHRALPPALRDLGDRYVKEEFRRHRAAGPAEAQRFLREWEETWWKSLNLSPHHYCFFGDVVAEEVEVFYHAIGYQESLMVGFSLHAVDATVICGRTSISKETIQNYAALIQQQINEDKQNSREKTVYGIQLTEEKLNDFRDEQIGQLKELMDEATKPN